MKISTALILCAGFGKRLNPITLKIPKPLIAINNLELLAHTINLIKNLGIKNIKINTFYLQDHIINFVNKHPLKSNIEIIKDGNKLLDTGGGILNLIKNSRENDFIVFNSDTLWTYDYKTVINDMIKIYFKNKMQNLLMVVNKAKSFDKRFKGDFELREKMLLRESICNYVFTGCQIINKELFDDINEEVFSILKIWNQQINKKKLYGYEYKGKFIHLTDLEIFKQLTKK